MMVIYVLQVSFHRGRETFLEPAEEHDLSLPNSLSSQVLSALVSHGCFSSTRELSAKPIQRIIWELRVWVSALEISEIEGLRDLKEIALKGRDQYIIFMI